MQTKLQWNQNVLEPVFRELYTREMEGRKDYIPLLYDVQGSTKDTESIEMIGGEGLLEEWKYSNNQVFYDDVDELWQKYFKHRKYSLGREIERDFVDDLKLTQIKDRIRSMADATYKTRQYQAVELYNNAFVTSTAVDFRGRTYDAKLPDGQALCSSAHPYSPTDSTTQSNAGTDELSIDSWDSTAIAMQEWKDDRGNLMAVIPDTLLVAPYNARRAFQIAGLPDKAAEYEPGSPNFNLNIYQGQINVIVNPFLKNRKAWFAMDSKRMMNAAKWFDRRKPESGSITDFDTEVAKYKVIGRWSYGAVDWSYVYGMNPS